MHGRQIPPSEAITSWPSIISSAQSGARVRKCPCPLLAAPSADDHNVPVRAQHHQPRARLQQLPCGCLLPRQGPHRVAPSRGPHRLLRRRQLLAPPLPGNSRQVLPHPRHRHARVQRHERRRTHGTTRVFHPILPPPLPSRTLCSHLYCSRTTACSVLRQIGAAGPTRHTDLAISVCLLRSPSPPQLPATACCVLRQIGAAAPTPQTALAFGPLITVLFMLFGGFYVNIDSIPVWIRWFRYLSPIQWGFVGLASNQFSGALVVQPLVCLLVERGPPRARETDSGCVRVLLRVRLPHPMGLGRPFHLGPQNSFVSPGPMQCIVSCPLPPCALLSPGLTFSCAPGEPGCFQTGEEVLAYLNLTEFSVRHSTPGTSVTY